MTGKGKIMLTQNEIQSGKLFDFLESEGIDSKPVAFQKQVLAIYEFVKNKNFTKTLEIGLGIGGSAVHILAATDGKHVSMDPLQETSYKNLGLKNVKKMGFDDRLEFYNDYSEYVLPELLKNERKFDFIYIDGDHKFDFVLMDFYFSDFLLEDNGYLLFDDAWMPSVKRVGEFIKANRLDYLLYESIYDEGILFRKNGSLKFKNPPFRMF